MDNTLKSSSAQQVQEILHQYNLDLEVIEFSESTRTSQEAADTIGCEVGQIAKSLIFKTKNSAKPVCIIASGKNRVDEKKIAAIIGEKIEKADAEFVGKHTGFAIGGIPPIGYSLEIKPLIDEDLMVYTELWAAAGTPNASFKITPQNLLTITGGTIVDLKK